MLKVVHSSRRLLVILVALVSAPILMSLVNNSASAANLTPSVMVNSSLTVTIPSTPINLNLNPYSNNFGYGDVTIKVGTNNPAGYKTIMTSVDGTTNLTDSEDAEKVIPTLTTSGLTESTFEVNHWGYKKDSGNYQPFTTDTVILESDTYANDDTTTLRFATKIDYMQPEGDYSTTLSFTTTATPNILTIQNLNPGLCTNNPALALDIRDNQIYTIQRLADGNCWIMDNLNLGATDTLAVTQLDNTNTNLVGVNASKTISASTFLGSTWKKSSGSSSYIAPEYIPITASNSADGLDTDPTSGTEYGTLYNYCAASAQTYCYDSSTDGVNASSDLCPAGWRLPTGNTSGEFQTLYNQSAYNSNANMRKSYTEGGAAFALPGYFLSSAPKNQGSNGVYWSSTRYSNKNMYRLSLNTSTLTSAESDSRAYGLSIRCVLKSQSMQGFTAAQARVMKPGEIKTLRDARDDQVYTVAKLADGNVWMLDNLRLNDSTIPITSDNSNVAYTSSNPWYLPSSSSSGFNSYETKMINTAYMNNTTTNVGSGSGKIGVYYNFCAATAGTYCYPEGAGTTDAQYDICPAGWHIPTSAYTVGNYRVLYKAYSNDATNFQTALSTPNSGGFYNSNAFDQGLYGSGRFWGSTPNHSNDSSMYGLSTYARSGATYPEAVFPRNYGFSVRCLFNPGS